MKRVTQKVVKEVVGSTTTTAVAVKSYPTIVKEYFVEQSKLDVDCKKNAPGMKHYMKDQFPFLGFKSPTRTSLLKSMIKLHGLPPSDDDIMPIYQSQHREFAYIAIELTLQRVKKSEPDKTRIKMYEEMIMYNSWWDTVDLIASNLVGQHFKRFPEQRLEYTEKWIKSDNNWLKRSALLFQLKYKKETDTDLLFRYIGETMSETDFFIRKAIGWSLREYSKVDKNIIIKYVDQHSTKLSTLSQREALKHCTK
ncbi:hypothetical protein DFA_07785 [Cavenderia fasciculata]|uniref:DNA alkylation repair enzyme n=1 Tax=Cavenderia fasciculata TaxID=261658 RepID=F4Q3D8_CACFS|nr:uncharacterized protein DFA_07785 [Cavenderia fasciculata]EGG16807.1 hypothetical protein DFA_07785 [Cavenderia fasciculata]|eukprot:XP_004355281.1 hypothetical protein DFA_07785 [Cavenderia fasciculata]